MDISSLGVFFHRGDTLAQGEASSGVPWLGRSLFSIVLSKLISGGLVVTDGSNLTPDGPQGLAQFHNDKEVQEAAATAARPFEYETRRFTCIAYAGTKNGPTLVWRVS